eukprot:jgi/Chlat1/4144/Chrsp27S04227
MAWSDYRREGRVGEGAFSTVYRATHLPTGETRALKASIGDLGLARPFVGGEEGGEEEEESRKYTHVVATRWYRAPELLFGSRHYGPAVDLWAVGCIFGELLTWAPLFPGDNDIDQLCRVRRALGSPSEDVWPGVSRLPDFGKVVFADDDNSSINSGGTLRTEIVPRGEVREEAAEFLDKFLRYDPSKRITAAEALQDPYFTSEPLPLPALDFLKLLPISPSSHLHARKPHDELVCHPTTTHNDVLAAFSMPPQKQQQKAALKTCVRCKKPFDPSANGSTACKFHGHMNGDPGLCSLSPPHQGIDGDWTETSNLQVIYLHNKKGDRPNTGRSNWKQRWSCCGTYGEDATPCRTGPHISYDEAGLW